MPEKSTTRSLKKEILDHDFDTAVENNAVQAILIIPCGSNRLINRRGSLGGLAGRGRGQVGGRGSCYGTLQTVYSAVLFNISLFWYKFEFIKKEQLYKKSQYL